MSDKKYTPAEAAMAVLKKAQELYKESILSKAEKIGQFGQRDLRRETGHEKGVHMPVGEGSKSSAGMGVLHSQPGKLNPQEGIEHAKKMHQNVLSQMKQIKPNLDKSEDPLTSVAGDRAKRAVGYKEGGDTLSHKIASEGSKEAHKERLAGIKTAPKPNLDKNEECGMKGHIKLAKFMGRMEAKRGEKSKMEKGETGYEKGVNTSGGHEGTSRMGNSVNYAVDAKQHYGGGKAHLIDAKNVAKDKLKEMKQMPKPKLPG